MTSPLRHAPAAEIAEALAAPRAAGGSRRRRAWFRARRAGVWALLVAPGLGIVTFDFLRRRTQIDHFDGHEMTSYLAWAACGAALWGALAYLAMARTTAMRWWARLLLLAGAALAVGGQAYIFSRYQAYLDHRAALVGTSMMPSVGQQLWIDRYDFGETVLPPILFALALPLLGRKLARRRRRAALFALDLSTVMLVLALFGNVGSAQDAPPDVLYVSAMGQLSRARWDHNETVERVHPGPRSPIPVPAIVARPPVPRNVLFVVTESVRAQSTCVAYDPDCAYTPFSNEAAKDRIPLTQMRALDSTTAISLAIMWGGHLPTASRKELHSMPLLWEYAKAAGLHTAYWTSQNLLFGNSGTWIASVPLDRTINATELEPGATMEIGADDGKLVDYVLGDIGNLPEPFTAVVHLSNTHFPYKIDEAHAPFMPQSMSGGPDHGQQLHNRYQDAIYLQDIAVGRLIRGIRSRPEGAHTVIFFVSDHGEQLGEKGGYGHTGTVWDQEIRIPAWIDAPPGTLTDAERAHLEALRDTPLTSLDVLPTLLDLMGVYDDPALAALKKPMPGHSLLRGGSPVETEVPLTNCTELWACAFRNWGAMRGTRKLLAHQGDSAWGCYDVASDPQERQDLGVGACADLLPLAQRRGRPF